MKSCYSECGKIRPSLIRRKQDKFFRRRTLAKSFFIKAIGSSGLPEKVTIDKGGANHVRLNSVNLQPIVFLLGCSLMQIIIRQIKYLHNIVEQDHRGVK